jgi:hypothetical protein
VGFVIGLLVWVALGCLLWRGIKRVRLKRVGRGPGSGSKKSDPWPGHEIDEARLWLDQLGPTHDERMAAIDRMFEVGHGDCAVERERGPAGAAGSRRDGADDRPKKGGVRLPRLCAASGYAL